MNIDRQHIIGLRKGLNWTQEDLAAASGLSARTIQRVERSGKASLDTTKALAIAFDVTVDALEVSEASESSGEKSKVFGWVSTALFVFALFVASGLFYLLYAMVLLPAYETAPPIVVVWMKILLSLTLIICWLVCFLVSTVLFMKRRYQAAKICLIMSAVLLTAALGNPIEDVTPMRGVTYILVYVSAYACFEYFRRKDTMFESA